MELTSVYLTEELAGLRQRVADLEASEAEYRSIEAELRERAYQQAMIAKLGQRVLAGGDFDPLLDEITVLVTQTLKVD